MMLDPTIVEAQLAARDKEISRLNSALEKMQAENKTALRFEIELHEAYAETKQLQFELDLAKEDATEFYAKNKALTQKNEQQADYIRVINRIVNNLRKELKDG